MNDLKDVAMIILNYNNDDFSISSALNILSFTKILI